MNSQTYAAALAPGPFRRRRDQLRSCVEVCPRRACWSTGCGPSGWSLACAQEPRRSGQASSDPAAGTDQTVRQLRAQQLGQPVEPSIVALPRSRRRLNTRGGRCQLNGSQPETTTTGDANHCRHSLLFRYTLSGKRDAGRCPPNKWILDLQCALGLDCSRSGHNTPANYRGCARWQQEHRGALVR